MSIRAAIIGPTGYTGLYLIDLLLRHPGVKLTYLASRRDEPTNIAEVFPQLLNRLPEEVATCKPISASAMAAAADVVFLCLPHRAAMEHVPALLKLGLHVIDLSADYRLADAEQYEQVYGQAHADADNLDAAVYGLPELFGEDIAGANLIANPGCYPTAAALGIAPLLDAKLVKPSSIIINAASGVTGAGRSPVQHLHFPEQNESYRAYGTIGAHRHQPEIEQTLTNVIDRDVSVLFVPHLLPVDRGILETIYLEPTKSNITEEQLYDVFEQAYDNEPFVRVRNDLPNVKHVRDTNFCDISVRYVAGDPPRIVVFSAIDNMIKGASGQAVQNMNIMFNLEETAGLL